MVDDERDDDEATDQGEASDDDDTDDASSDGGGDRPRDYVEYVSRCCCGALLDVDVPPSFEEQARLQLNRWHRRHAGCVETWRSAADRGDVGS